MMDFYRVVKLFQNQSRNLRTLCIPHVPSSILGKEEIIVGSVRFIDIMIQKEEW